MNSLIGELYGRDLAAQAGLSYDSVLEALRTAADQGRPAALSYVPVGSTEKAERFFQDLRLTFQRQSQFPCIERLHALTGQMELHAPYLVSWLSCWQVVENRYAQES